MPSRSLRRLPWLPLAGLGLVVLAAAAALWLSYAQARANAWSIHTVEAEVKITRTLEAVRAVESNHRGYLIAGDSAFLTDLDQAKATATASVEDLARHIADNPVQRRIIAELKPLISDKLQFAQESARLMRTGRVSLAQEMMANGQGRRLMIAISDRLTAMRLHEDALLAQRNARSQLLVTLLAIGLAIGMLLVVAVGLFTVSDARRRYAMTDLARLEAEQAADRLRHEMTARAQAEDQLRQMQKMESVGQLTGGIAHDFNNMLAIVIGSLDLAQRRLTGDPEKLGRYLANAREGAERAASLTARLLAFSRQSPLAPVAIDANKMVAGMSELLRRTLGEQIRVETVLAGGLWPTFADSSQLENAIVNLAVNARDAMLDGPEGGGRLTIETANAHLDDDYARDRMDVRPGQYVLVCVTDTGGGMPPEVIERAFDPFFTTKGVGKGTGLGLSQVFGFVKQSGGHVAIYSEEGRGTTVKLYMPRAQGAALEAQPATAATVDIPLGRTEEVILVVEDEQRVRHFSVDALRELGYTALSASTPSEALKILEDQPQIALLFTDIVMPEMDGRRLADRVLERRPGLRVLYTTGYTRNAVVHNGMLDLGVAFLPKPFTISQLARKVREVLDGAGVNRPA